jgi:hypothetical protein
MKIEVIINGIKIQPLFVKDIYSGWIDCIIKPHIDLINLKKEDIDDIMMKINDTYVYTGLDFKVKYCQRAVISNNFTNILFKFED